MVFSAAQVADAGIQGDTVEPGAEATSVFECGVAFPQVIHRFLIEIGNIFLVLCIHQAHFVDDVLVLQQQFGEFFFLVSIRHILVFCFVSRARLRLSYREGVIFLFRNNFPHIWEISAV